MKYFWFLQGWLRYWLYYSRFNWLLRSHIREQIDVRIRSMDRVCYMSGSCRLCGCSTTALQMANKMCDGACYPVMVSRGIWRRMKLREDYLFCYDGSCFYLKGGKFYVI